MKKSVTFLLCLYHLTTAGKLEIVPIIITVICNTLSNFSAENHKLLVALGNDELDMEIIDLKTGSSCQVDDFVPESFTEASAIGFLHENDNVVTICPYNDGPVTEKRCWDLDSSTKKWAKTARMIDNADFAAVVALGNDSVWIGGGEDIGYYWTDSEKYDGRLGKFVPSVKLPQAKSGSCAVHLGDGKVFLVGGYPFSRRAWILNTKTGGVENQVTAPTMFHIPQIF